MKIKNVLSTSLLVITTIFTPASSVFAVTDYGMLYSGGESLNSTNMQIQPGLVDELTTLMNLTNTKNVAFSHSNLWKEGYWKNGASCDKVRFFEIKEGVSDYSANDLSIDIESEQYITNVKFNNIILQDTSNKLTEDGYYVLGISEGDGRINVGYEVYSDTECSNIITNNKRQILRHETRIFVETNIKLSRKDATDIPSDRLYFGVTDIDAAQSFKILNQNNLLTSESMIARSGTALQPTDSELRNMFVADGNYIYSEYDGVNFKDFLINGGNDVFTKVNVNIKKDGLDVVFGFAEAATSGVEFYAKQFPIHYRSDNNGVITGITDEEIIAGNSPFGSKTKPNDNYEFTHWIADKDVTLEDGTVIKVNEAMTSEQVKKVIVEEELTFTAIHKTIPVIPVPNTGVSTGELNAERVAMPIGIGVALFLAGLVTSVIQRKKSKVKF